MKKFIVFAAIAASAFSMNAQLSVLKSGNIRIGSTYLQLQTGIGGMLNYGVDAIYPSIEIQTDSLASMNILGKSTNGSNGYITFGNLRKAGIGEYKKNGQSDSDMLGLFGELGLTFTSNSNVVFSYTKMFSTSTPSFVIRNQGSLTLNTDNAFLKGDKVEAGGTLNVKAHQVTLEAGVTIEAGATANFLTN